MIENFDSVKKQLSQLAEVINSFKSEAVQLRIIELVLGERSEDAAEPRSEGKPSRKSAKGRKRSKLSMEPESKDSSSPPKKSKSSGGKGAQSILSQLIAGTFFDTPRTIGDIVEHTKHNLAVNFKASDFSGKLARKIRSGELTRKKNSDKQYEYKKP